MHGTHVTVDDDMTLIESLFLDARSVTLNSFINIPGVFPIDPKTFAPAAGTPMTDWVGTNAPRLLYFTNTGTLLIPNTANFGADRPRYITFVNSGTLQARSIKARTQYLENSSNIISGGDFKVQFDTAVFTNGSTVAGAEMRFTGGALLMSNHKLTNATALNLEISTFLSDAGVGSTLDVGCSTEGGAPPDVIGAAAAYLCTAPEARELNGQWIEGQELTARLGLLPGWDSPGSVSVPAGDGLDS
jgi:hypothetical protein